MKTGKKCPVCGELFSTGHDPRNKTCSLECGQKLRFKTDPKVRQLLWKYRYNCIGWHGSKRGLKDNPNHANAICARIRDPLGGVYEIKNVTSWCRKNERLFALYDNSDAKSALWRRAQVGLQSVFDGYKDSWYGWIAEPIIKK